MKLLLHIGFHKTGSSAIQRALSSSPMLLKNRGFIYADFAINHSILAKMFMPKAEKNYGIRARGFDRIKLLKYLEEKVGRLDEQIESCQAHTCIVSGEDFSIIDESNIRGFHDFFKQRFEAIKIIAYVRLPESLYCSLVQEVSKGAVNILNSFATPSQFKANNKKKLLTYIREFGQDSVEVVKFSSDNLHNGDVVDDFCQRYLQDDSGSDLKLNSQRVNESIPGALVVMLSMLSEEIPPFAERGLNPLWKKLDRALMQLKPSPTMPKLALPHAWKEIIKYNNKSENQWIEDTFFQGVRGSFSEELDSQAFVPSEVTRSELQDWLMSYLTPEAWQEIILHLRNSGDDDLSRISHNLEAANLGEIVKDKELLKIRPMNREDMELDPEALDLEVKEKNEPMLREELLIEPDKWPMKLNQTRKDLQRSQMKLNQIRKDLQRYIC